MVEREERRYTTVQDIHIDYEDPEYFYGQIGNAPSHSSKESCTRHIMVGSPPVPPAPPPLKPTHIAIHNSTKRTTPRWRSICLGTILGLITLALITSIIALLLVGSRSHSLFQRFQTVPSRSEPVFPILPSDVLRKSESDISPSHLLTLLITKRKVCLFEAGSGDEEHAKEMFEQDHIEGAQLLFHSNLSHSGVPVHPLQFQRYARSLGVDNNCHVVIYDRGQIIWSTYAAWIFKLFGHQRVSLLNGGYLAWKTQQGRSNQYITKSGMSKKPTMGDFQSSWNQSLIITFDDVLLNTQQNTYDVVDAQTKEEYHGTAKDALYGHIRGAVNVPVDSVFDWGTGEWLSLSDLSTVFQNSGLNTERPVIVYCSTSLRASMVWWALNRLGYQARIYFGGWPEWVVRSPDNVKQFNNGS